VGCLVARPLVPVGLVGFHGAGPFGNLFAIRFLASDPCARIAGCCTWSTFVHGEVGWRPRNLGRRGADVGMFWAVLLWISRSAASLTLNASLKFWGVNERHSPDAPSRHDCVSGASIRGQLAASSRMGGESASVRHSGGSRRVLRVQQSCVNCKIFDRGRCARHVGFSWHLASLVSIIGRCIR